MPFNNQVQLLVHTCLLEWKRVELMKQLPKILGRWDTCDNVVDVKWDLEPKRLPLLSRIPVRDQRRKFGLILRHLTDWKERIIYKTAWSGEPIREVLDGLLMDKEKITLGSWDLWCLRIGVLNLYLIDEDGTSHYIEIEQKQGIVNGTCTGREKRVYSTSSDVDSLIRDVSDAWLDARTLDETVVYYYTTCYFHDIDHETRRVQAIMDMYNDINTELVATCIRKG